MPVISPSVKRGTPVRQDQFYMDFNVEVDTDGCYAIDFRLMEDVSLDYDRVVLQYTSAFGEACCFTAGVAKKFRITTNEPPAPGATATPPPAAGTTVLPPVEGTWPTTSDPSGKTSTLYYEIDVYQTGVCTGAPASCATSDRRVARKGTKYMTLSNYETATASKVSVALLTEPKIEEPSEALVALMPSALHRHERPLSFGHGPVSFLLYHANDQSTFFEPSVVLERHETRGREGKLSFRMGLRNNYPNLKALARAVMTYESLMPRIEKNDGDAIRDGYFARAGFQRHGLATFYDAESTVSTLFVNDQGIMVRYNGELPDRPIVMANAAPVTSGGGGVPPVLATVGEDVSIVFPDTFELGFSVHLFSWAVNWGAYLCPGFKYRNDIAEAITETFDPLIAAGKCIKRLRIHSHGGKLVMPNGTVVGSTICTGKTEMIRSDEFDLAGVPVPGTPTDTLLQKLKKVMCQPSEIIFDACNQGVGEMLKNISSFLAPSCTVKGYRDLGVPWGEGDVSYTNGKPN